MRCRIKAVFLIVVFALPSLGGAQAKNLTMSGIVTDRQSRRPVEGARVTVIGNTAKSDTTTDIGGSFIVTLAKGVEEGSSVRIRVEKLGYASYDKWVAVSSTIPLQVSLLAIRAMPAGPAPPLPQPHVASERNGKNDKVEGEAHHAVGVEFGAPNNEIFAELTCDLGFMFVDVPRGSTAYILTLRDNLTAELVTFTNTDTESYRWPESTEQPLLDPGLDCAITNSSKETFLNIQADFIVEFDAEHPLAVVGKSLHTFYINSLEPGKSYLFHVINQSRFFAILNPPDKFPTRLLGMQQPRIVPLVRRNRSAADFAPIGLWRSKYKWQGNKVIGPADMPH
jgi:hypothetical protein